VGIFGEFADAVRRGEGSRGAGEKESKRVRE
jgi:hypothetical protein